MAPQLYFSSKYRHSHLFHLIERRKSGIFQLQLAQMSYCQKRTVSFEGSSHKEIKLSITVWVTFGKELLEQALTKRVNFS